MALHAIEQRTDMESALQRWAARYDCVHVDLGTGDGTYAITLARRTPQIGVIGLDTNLDRLRGARRRYPRNVRFVAGDALAVPAGLPATVGAVSINFPYGSLLRGLVDGDPGLLTWTDATLECGGCLEVRVNETAMMAVGIDPEGGSAAIADHLRQIPGLRVGLRPMMRSDLRVFPSSWSKRLGYGRETCAWLIEGRRNP